MNGDYMDIRFHVKDETIAEKLEIIRLERGIALNSFVTKAVVEKLRREGYLQNGIQKHEPREPQKRKKELSSIDRLRKSIQEISMRKP